jgi:thiol-disulfide isomerase/thioredoxin
VKNDEELFIFFYADWCPACHDFKPALNLMTEGDFFENHGVSVYRVNVEETPELTARFLIVSLPTLIHVRSGLFRDITKSRWKLIEYFEEKLWTEHVPISNWKSPVGTFASFLGVSTRLGQRIAKQAESLGWPKWKWAVAFFVSFAIAWIPALLLTMSNSRSSGMNRTEDVIKSSIVSEDKGPECVDNTMEDECEDSPDEMEPNK